MYYVREREAHTLEERIISHRKDAEEFFRKYLKDNPVEIFCVVALNNRNSIIGFITNEGSTNQCATYPSNIFRFLLSSGASSFIIAHNHPGGGTNPSESDWILTERLFKAGALLDLPLVDHLIITEMDAVAMREMARWSSMASK
jgi:DNA repair protein RadC